MSCIITSWSSFQPSHAYTCIPFSLVCCCHSFISLITSYILAIILRSINFSDDVIGSYGIIFFCLLIYQALWVCHSRVSWWSLTCLCDNNSFHVTRTLLSILADSNHTVIFWFSNPPVFFPQALEDCFKQANYKWHHCGPHVPQLVYIHFF